MKASSSARPVLAALGAAALFSGCVSVGEYEQVKGQLEIEQRKAVEREKRASELEVLSENLRRRLEVAELERGRARERLRAASRALALKPPEAISRRPPVRPQTGTRAISEAALVGTVYFTPGSGNVSDEARKEIARVARGLAGKLAGKKDAEILVCGHSDPTPIEHSKGRFESNMHLSAMRALVVCQELVASPGIDPARVVVVAYGKHRPVADPEQVRRVEIRLRAAKSGAARLGSPKSARSVGRGAAAGPPKGRSLPSDLTTGGGPAVPASGAARRPARGPRPPAASPRGGEPEPWRK